MRNPKTKKLILQKDTLGRLTADELRKAAGGRTGLYSCVCPPTSDPCVTDQCPFTQQANCH